MCGISGIFGIEKINDPRKIVEVMNHAMAHRGPDADGIYQGSNVVLGHRRLSIIDLSAESNQPFFSDDKRYCIVFNGEIYNYQKLRDELKEFSFRTSSDTEVLLNAYRKWGMDFLEKLEGMFAFAIWDTVEQKLILVRDRLGIKPVYYFQNNQSVLFASEIRALLSSGLIARKINQDSLIDYLRYQTVHAPQTMIEGISMLMPGHYMIISDTEIEMREYWSLDTAAKSISENTTEAGIHSKIKMLFEDAVKKRMIADVPFGAFLSGGIDSSAVVAMMAQHSSKPVKTFCVSFDESEFSEAKYAKLVSEKYATDHTEIKLTPADFLQLLPGSLSSMDHPSGDGPNTFVVSKVTKESGITMALSGLGGDELFAGYDSFIRLKKMRSKEWLQYFPIVFRTAGASVMQTVKPSVSSDKLSEFLRLQYYFIENVYPLTRKVLTEKKIKEITGLEKLPSNKVYQIVNNLFGVRGTASRYSDFSKITLAEISTYLQNVLLRDTDQMSMAHALEVRVPFLDHDLVSYVLGVRDGLKYPHSPKKLLTDSLGDLIPSEIIHRPKMGFTFPWEKWMKNELKDFCQDRICSISKRKYFKEQAVQNLWQAFLKNDKRVTWSRIWYLVVLEDWLCRNSITD